MLRKSIAILLLGLVSAGGLLAAEPDRTKLPIPLSPFEGKIGKTYKDSEADWQAPVAAPAGAPNVIVILLDDVGFGQTSTFGGLNNEERLLVQYGPCMRDNLAWALDPSTSCDAPGCTDPWGLPG